MYISTLCHGQREPSVKSFGQGAQLPFGDGDPVAAAAHFSSSDFTLGIFPPTCEWQALQLPFFSWETEAQGGEGTSQG